MLSEENSVVESNGKITYKGDRFDGVVNTTIRDKSGGTNTSKMNMSGRRIGDCK